MANLVKQKDKEVFLRLLCAVVSGEQNVSIPEDTDLKALYLASRAHKVAGTICFALKGFKPKSEDDKKAYEHFVSYFIGQEKKQVYQRHYTELICNLCREKGIKFALLKGSVIKDLYPDCLMRVMGDIDILVDNWGIDEIAQSLLQDGFEYLHQENHDTAKHICLIKNGILIELHRRIFEKGWFEGQYDNPFDVLESDDAIEYHFSPEQLYVYNIAHSRQHFIKSINTLRSVCDSYIIRKSFPSMDMTLVGNLLEKMGISVFEKGISELIDVLFYGKPAKKEIATSLDYIFYNPIRADHGLSIVQKRKFRFRNKFLRRIEVLFWVIFLDYEQLCWVYPKASKSKLLYPYYTAKRIFKAVSTKKIRNNINIVRSYNDDQIQMTEMVKSYFGI